MKLEKEIEEKLIKEVHNIFADDKFVYEHTLSTARCMKELVSKEGGNEKVLVTAMYLHDIGYAGLIKGKPAFDAYVAVKPKHMILGAERAVEILIRLGGYSKNEIEQIVHLVSVHDKLNDLKTRDEFLVFEADSLGSIDPAVENAYNEEDLARSVKSFEEWRAPRFVTKTGKKLLVKFARENELFQRFTKNYEK